MKKKSLGKLKIKKETISAFDTFKVEGGARTDTTNYIDCGETINRTFCYGSPVCRKFDTNPCGW